MKESLEKLQKVSKTQTLRAEPFFSVRLKSNVPYGICLCFLKEFDAF